jgi:flagellin-specific chaperone FliS
MNATQAYRQNQNVGMSRVDLILALYDGVIERLEKARVALASDPDKARELLAQCQVVIGAIAGGVVSGADQVAGNFLRLYEYVVHCLHDGGDGRIQDALAVLRILRQGFQQARTQALELERQGQIPPLDQTHLVEAIG